LYLESARINFSINTSEKKMKKINKLGGKMLDEGTYEKVEKF